MEKSKKALFRSIVSLLLCLSMFVGTTFAWFTDSETSSNNIIKSGNLDVEMHWTDDIDPADGQVDWQDASKGAIFNHAYWEPGYTDVKYVKISNVGDLAFQYQLHIIPDNVILVADYNLADVIDVYYGVVGDDFTAPVYFSENMEGLTKVGTLSELMAESDGAAHGVLLPEEGKSKVDAELPAGVTAETGSVTACIVLHMQESAGNEYQNLSVGNGFSVQLLATQYTYEKDSFDNTYDSNSVFPELDLPMTESGTVVTDANHQVAEETTISGISQISALVPVGVQLQEGVNELTLTVSEVSVSGSNVILGEQEAMRSLDVHIEGVAENNTVPMIIDLGVVMPIGMNRGNVSLYHVEGGNTNAMTQVYTLDELDAHNEFYYDPATGNVTVALATFSEIAFVADTENEWKGAIDSSFAGGDGSKENPYLIANADQLAYLSKQVSNYNEEYGDKCYKLIANVNFGGSENAEKGNVFYPIGYWAKAVDENSSPLTNTAGENYFVYGGSFKGVFDGNGNTISNLYQNTWLMDGDYDNGYWNEAMGVFGYVNGGTVKNLTVDNFSSDGEFTPTGCVAAYAVGKATFENISIVNSNPRVYNTGNGGVVGVGGDSESANASGNLITFKNITVDQTNKISALWGSWDVACGGIMGMFRGYSQVSFENCHVAAQIDVNNDVCANYQYYWYRYSGMFIGSVRRNTKDSNGYTVAYTEGITATGCTYTYGDWNEYWYCELVANTKASYTHDHQFSRLTKISSVSEIQDENGNWNKEGNFVVPAADNSSATCYHIFKDSEGTLYQHKHDVADESNPDIYEDFDLNGDGELNDLKEDRVCYYIPFGQLFTGNGWGVKANYEFDGIIEVEDGTVKSEQKFKAVGTITTYTPGESIKIGDLFESIVNDTKLSMTSIFVAVSPYGDDSTASATYQIDKDDWKNGTITFSKDSKGSAKVVITDYYYCTETVIYLGEPDFVEKFTAKSVNAVDADTTITVGDLFAVKDGVTLGDVTITVTAPDGTVSIIDAAATEWAEKEITLNDDGDWSVSIADDAYCVPTENTIIVNAIDKFVVAFDHDETTEGNQNYVSEYLYRVGNGNAVALSSLFEAVDAETEEVDTETTINNVVVTVANMQGNAAGTYTANASDWTKGTIQFSGTGVVSVTISCDGGNEEELLLEVVDAYNVTAYSELSNRNIVLLKNITMSDNSSYYLSGATLYGNGFIFDASKGAYASAGNLSSNYVIGLNNAALDNVEIIGAVYTSYGATVKDDYNRSLVLSTGNNTITNCYLSNCAAPVRVNGGTLEIINSTLKGGNFANLDIRNGHVILDNVTTINQVNGNDTADGTVVVGLGVVVYYENVLSTTTVEVRNGITQYNHLSKTQANTYITDTTAKQLTAVMYNDDYEKIQYSDGNDIWVNTGILSMTETIGNDSITNVDGYTDASPYFREVTGYVHTKTPNETSIAAEVPAYETSGQGAIAPAYSFDYTTKNYVAKTDGSNDYCYEEDGTVYISMDEGDSFNWDTSILTVTKNGQTLDYSVSMDGIDYTGKSIAFNTTGNYTVTYTYTDSNNYGVDEKGNITTYSKTYNKTVHLSVAVIKANAKNAEFAFGSSNTATEKIAVDNVTYISATGVDYDGTSWAYMTVGDEKIYYPIVAAKLTSTSGSSSIAYFPVFENVVTITDYADGGTGDAVTYNGSTTSMPDNLTAVKGVYKAAADVTYWYNLNNSHLTQSGASNIFKWASSSSAESLPTTYDSVLCFKSPTISASRDKYITLVQYSYTDATNTTYYYYVGYTLAAYTYKACVTPDTLVTLADGTQKRIDQVEYTDQLLIWNFYTGEYDTAPASIIMNHGYDKYTVVTLNFADGTSINTINGHGFYDKGLKEFVILSEENVASYVGHSFIKQNGDGYSTTKLISYSIAEEYTESWSVLTAEHYNCILEGMWTLTPAEVEGSPDYLMPFEIGTDMKYDAAAMQADIAKYGLYTYEEFSEYMTYEQFTALNLPIFKVAVGKGYITYDEILYLIRIHISQ